MSAARAEAASDFLSEAADDLTAYIIEKLVTTELALAVVGEVNRRLSVQQDMRLVKAFRRAFSEEQAEETAAAKSPNDDTTMGDGR